MRVASRKCREPGPDGKLTCTRCGDTKQHWHFYRRKPPRRGFQSRCRKCVMELAVQRRKSLPVLVQSLLNRKYTRAYRERKRMRDSQEQRNAVQAGAESA